MRILKAAIAGMLSKLKRVTAYSIFSSGYSLSWFLSSGLMGILSHPSIPALIVFFSTTQFLYNLVDF
ncbi:hypothetical protein [Nostoc sp.]|uniref:hypothetical protein n=1 Tax=Nostoc sp. TaxID=1180 RepID=UPI003FA55458